MDSDSIIKEWTKRGIKIPLFLHNYLFLELSWNTIVYPSIK